MRLSALETRATRLAAKLATELATKLAGPRVSNTMANRSPYRTSNPVCGDCSTKWTRNFGSLSPCLLLLSRPHTVNFALPSAFRQFRIPAMVRRVADSRGRSAARVRDWIKTCCGVLMRAIGQLAAFGQQKPERGGPAHFDVMKSPWLRLNRKRILEEDFSFKN